ncbi:CLUMA_CG004721, isoform A, partial [Clunio marinus]
FRYLHTRTRFRKLFCKFKRTDDLELNKINSNMASEFFLTHDELESCVLEESKDNGTKQWVLCNSANAVEGKTNYTVVFLKKLSDLYKGIVGWSQSFRKKSKSGIMTSKWVCPHGDSISVRVHQADLKPKKGHSTSFTTKTECKDCKAQIAGRNGEVEDNVQVSKEDDGTPAAEKKRNEVLEILVKLRQGMNEIAKQTILGALDATLSYTSTDDKLECMINSIPLIAGQIQAFLLNERNTLLMKMEEEEALKQNQAQE